MGRRNGDPKPGEPKSPQPHINNQTPFLRWALEP